MTADEISLLLDTAQKGPVRYGMTGSQRSMLYRLAVETGLRASELRALTVQDFDFDTLTVSLGAAHTKNRQSARQPLKADTAARLRPFLAGKMPTAAVFALPAVYSISRMIQADLRAAGINPADDGKGKLDFHSLRHTFATLLIAAGVNVKTAQSLLRHSTPTLTLGLYTHTLKGSEQRAIDCLPNFDRVPASEQSRATGTDGKAEESAYRILTGNSGQRVKICPILTYRKRQR